MKRSIQLEQGILSLDGESTNQNEIELFVQVSIAISLKRIADSLDSHTGPSLSIRESLHELQRNR